MSFEPVIIKLGTPVTHGNTEYTELVFGRELCAGDLRGDINVGTPTYDHCATVASRMLGIPPSIFSKMPWSDFSQVVNAVVNFFNDTPLTGERG